MKAVVRTTTWVIVLVMLLAAGGGAYVWDLLQQQEEILRAQILAKFQEIQPSWHIELSRARADFQGRIHLYQFKLRTAPHLQPILDIPEAVLVLDRERLTEKNPPLQQIRILRAQLRLNRDASGHWNWEDLEPPKLSETLVEWQFEKLLMTVQLEATSHSEATGLTLQDLDLQLVPSGHRQYHVKTSAHVSLAEAIVAEGRWNLLQHTWNVAGDLTGIRTTPELRTFLEALSPEMRDRLARGDLMSQQLADAAASIGSAVVQPVIPATPGMPVSVYPFGITATLDLNFQAHQAVAPAKLDYSITTQIRQGQMSHPALPFPLYDISGIVVSSGRQSEIRNLSAQNGPTRFVVNGTITNSLERPPAHLVIQAEKLILDERVRSRLPGKLHDIYDSLQPTGTVNGQVTLDCDGNSPWRCATNLDLIGCSVSHHKFPYRVHQVEGTIRQRENLVEVAVRGLASQRPVVVVGEVRNPGPEAEAVFEIQLQQLPLNETFRAACPPKVQAVLAAIHARGAADGHVWVTRPAGLGQKFRTDVHARLLNCSVTCKHFPYPISRITGLIEGGSGVWNFKELRGQHDAVTLTGEGVFREDKAGADSLRLDVNAQGAKFDQALLAALPKAWQTVWKEFTPSGSLNAATRIDWINGSAPQVRVEAEVHDASMQMKSFSYPLENLQARVLLDRGKIAIRSLSAEHEEMRLRTTGEGECNANGEWRIRFENLFVDDLSPDRQFRKSLPPTLREIIETLDPRGKLSLSGMLEFRGVRDAAELVTAAWDLKTIYSGTKVTAGIDLDNIHGSVEVRGTWDGERVLGSGQINLDSLSIRGFQLTRVEGPLSIKGSQLVLGSQLVVDPRQMEPVPDDVLDPSIPKERGKRITARFIDGVLSLDGVAVLEGLTSYRVRMTLANGKLERYAQLYLPGQNRLMGVMNGWVDLTGRGASAQRLKGQGQLQISPAALYELPVFVAIFNAIPSLRPPDTTAFDFARMIFDIGGGQMHIKRADLVGNAINLQGRGVVKFGDRASNSRLNLNFYSSVGRSQLAIPLVRELIGEATKGWVGVDVSGTVASPKAVIRPVPQLDDALRNFLGVFDNRAPRQPQPPRQRQRQANR